MRTVDEENLLNIYFARFFEKDEKDEVDKIYIGESFYLFILRSNSIVSCSCVFDKYVNFSYDSFYKESLRMRATTTDKLKEKTSTVYQWSRWIWDFDDKIEETVKEGTDKVVRDAKGNLIHLENTNAAVDEFKNMNTRTIVNTDGKLKDL